MKLTFSPEDGERYTLSGVKHFEINEDSIYIETHGGVEENIEHDLVTGKDNPILMDHSEEDTEEGTEEDTEEDN